MPMAIYIIKDWSKKMTNALHKPYRSYLNCWFITYNKPGTIILNALVNKILYAAMPWHN